MSQLQRSLSILQLLACMVLGAHFSTSVAAQDRLIVKPRRVVVRRTGKEVRDFPERRTAIVRYPIVLGLADAAALRRIQTTLGMKNVFDTSLADFRRNPGLLSFDYEVNYNKNYLLDITFTSEFEGAYPDTSTKHFLLNLKTGKPIKAADAFNRELLNNLAAAVDKKLKAEITEQLKANEDDKSADADAKSFVREELNKLRIEVKNLDDFAVSDKGITFLFDAGFPHVIQALQPAGRYFFSHAEIRPYLKGDGPLSILK